MWSKGQVNKMAGYIIIAAGLLAVGFGAWLCLRPPMKHKYLVTYESPLKTGGWTHAEVIVTVEKLNAAALDAAREWVRTNRTDITEAVCVLNVVRLDE